VRDNHQWLAARVYVRSVQGVAGDYGDVFWEVFFEGGDFRGFAGGLASDYGVEFGS
jgi:hypothetical protein